MSVIVTSRGESIIVDDDMLPLIELRTWYLDGWGYPWSCIREKGKKVGIRLHRVVAGMQCIITGRSEGSISVDHINRNKLDCRRCNLRLATARQQILNRIDGRGAGKFIGVFRQGNKFYAICRNKRVGTFSTAEEAAFAYDAALLQGLPLCDKRFATLNFPDAVLVEYKTTGMEIHFARS